MEDALKQFTDDGGSVVSGGGLARSESKESLHSNQSNQSGQSAALRESNDNRRQVKLPKLEIKKFSGKIGEWQEFWDGFKSAVHEDE